MTTKAMLNALLALPLPHRIMALIADNGGEARLVGGIVRDVLHGLAVDGLTDIDMAVNRPPADCRKWLEDAGFRVIPTGIDHGTITVLGHDDNRIRVELTSLRADIRTDGRHAEVVFGDDWDADARRRDFTINAIYLAADGTIFDPLCGRDDLARGVVRFAGNAAQRIREDYLRMLRFFRFHARFGSTVPDQQAMDAIGQHASGLDNISGERIIQELHGILKTGNTAVISAIIETGLDRMIAADGFNENGYGFLAGFTAQIDPMHLLGFLLRFQDTEAAAKRLRLSRRDAALLNKAAHGGEAWRRLGCDDWQKYAYLACRDEGVSPAALAGLYAAAAADRGMPDAEVFNRLGSWQPPQFPVGGDDLINRGIPRGKGMGRQLRVLEQYWIDSNFRHGRDVLLKMLDAGKVTD